MVYRLRIILSLVIKHNNKRLKHHRQNFNFSNEMQKQQDLI